MEQNVVKVKSVEKATHDVLRIVTEKPKNYNFNPGQATDVAINKDGWQKELRPFTFTCLPDDNHLEFTIKTYPSHKGVTNELLRLKPNDELIIGDSWGTIGYKSEGVFIAGGAGVTPFISIFRYLQSKNEIGNSKLIFANKTKADIINESEFKKALGKNFINVLSGEKVDGYEQGYITEDLLRKNITGKGTLIYLCGPEPMMEVVEKQLSNLGISLEAVIKEKF
ncbi:MAG: flavodoxin reductase [Cyclobacteriaceae bacterium]|jgi:ferredoxin-NADP reductase|nr:flavodoxin reductase [Cyclobacteriaceae bacterium]